MASRAEVLTRDGLYPVGDNAFKYPPLRFRAQWTGEKRPPCAGDWYLSGAIITAYQAPSDLATPYHIARIVEIEVVTTTRIVGTLEQAPQRGGR